MSFENLKNFHCPYASSRKWVLMIDASLGIIPTKKKEKKIADVVAVEKAHHQFTGKF